MKSGSIGKSVFTFHFAEYGFATYLYFASMTQELQQFLNKLSMIAVAMDFIPLPASFGMIMLAFTVLAGLSIVLGMVISKLVPLRCVRISSGLLLVFGVVFIWSAVSGVEPF
jgi:uncharacterized membrane protein